MTTTARARRTRRPPARRCRTRRPRPRAAATRPSASRTTRTSAKSWSTPTAHPLPVREGLWNDERLLRCVRERMAAATRERSADRRPRGGCLADRDDQPVRWKAPGHLQRTSAVHVRDGPEPGRRQRPGLDGLRRQLVGAVCGRRPGHRLGFELEQLIELERHVDHRAVDPARAVAWATSASQIPEGRRSGWRSAAPLRSGSAALELGGRFWTKASTPSTKSAVWPCSAWASASASSCLAIPA